MSDYNKNRAAAAPRPRPETPNLPAAAVWVAVAEAAEVAEVAEAEAPAVRDEMTEEGMGASAFEQKSSANCRDSVLGLRQRS